MRIVAALAVSCVVMASCAAPAGLEAVDAAAPSSPTARILLVGDVMLGRGVALVASAQPDEVFAGVRHLVAAADVAAANLESPLTARPDISTNDNRLAADLSAAEILASAGFDVVSLANNHSTDSGPAGLLDTLAATSSAGLVPIGAGIDGARATAPAVLKAAGLTIAFLGFDATGIGLTAGAGPGVASWDQASAVAAVADAARIADTVVVSVHGGTEYLPTSDPGMTEIGRTLVGAGADVVWGHGAHVVQPVAMIDNRLMATSLGNFLFDQAGPERTTGLLLEVLVDKGGVIAYRVGVTQHPDRRVEFVEWQRPEGDAVWLHESWWALVRDVRPAPSTATTVADFRHGDLVAAARGDVNDDGRDEIVASFRRPARSTPMRELAPDLEWIDQEGRSAHLGVYEPGGLDEIWVAGSVIRPVNGLEVCDGAVAVIHDRLDDVQVVAGGAWRWNGFGFATAPELPGQASPRCADVDGDGRTEPVIGRRTDRAAG